MADNVLTRKLGPLPTWGWASIFGGGVVVLAVVARRKKSSSGDTSSADLTPPEVIQVFPPEQPPATGGTTAGNVTVPDVAGQDYETAQVAVTKAGLKPKRATPDVGKVTTETPKAGSTVARGTTITLAGKARPARPRAARPVPHGGGAGAPRKPAA